MKKYIFILSILISALNSFAQDIKESTFLINNANQPCITANYALSGEIIEGAFIKKMTDAKLNKSSKASNGFKVYKKVIISEEKACFCSLSLSMGIFARVLRRLYTVCYVTDNHKHFNLPISLSNNTMSGQ